MTPVVIVGSIPDGYAIQPVTADEDIFADFAHLCGFASYDDALMFITEAGYELYEE